MPYALVSNSAIGGVFDVTEVRVNGTTVIDGDGAISAVVDWSSVENTPDVLGDLACSDGDHPVFSGGLWACGGPSAHVHDASDISTGTIDIARLPVGTSTDSVAAGDHTHPEYVVDGTDFATSNQGCGDGEKVVGIDASGALQCAADIDTDTTYDGTAFATSNQGCDSDEKVVGIDASGNVQCAADIDTNTNTTYDGSDFATSDQGCDSDEKVVGIDASGALQCAADIDTNTNTTYDGTDFALSGKTCPANQVVTGISSSGNPICGGFSTYRQNCSGAGCTTPACASGDILLGCTFYSDPGTDSDDMDFSPNYSNRTCSKGSNDPAYGLSAMCMRIP